MFDWAWMKECVEKWTGDVCYTWLSERMDGLDMCLTRLDEWMEERFDWLYV